MQHEDFNILYSEIMYKERDIIEKFLKDQYDIRYGHQRDTWHFEPSVRLINNYGVEVAVTDIRLDKSDFVLFTGVCCSEKHNDYKCYEFAYGELSKVIEALPDADDIVIKNAVSDLSKFANNLRCDLILQESPFEFEDTKVNNVLNDDGGVHICVGGRALAEENFSADFLSRLRDHINIEVLHRSNEYKELMELLSLQENLKFECHDYGDALFVIDGTDMTFDVACLHRDDEGNLVIYGNDYDADVCDGITLTEKDIKPQYLASIIECMKPKYSDIMDTYNGHNQELVHKINSAWKSGKYNQEFGYIIYSIASRDYNECKEKFDCDMDNLLSSIIDDCNESSIHNVLENVCDDWDLETILSFIRYEE